jgi:hypothetical protein
MALKNLFLVYPTGKEVYAWEIRNTRLGVRPISGHKYLGFALLEAERLNHVAHQKELARQRKSKVVCITQGQMSERQLSDSYIRSLQDACGVNRKEWDR